MVENCPYKNKCNGKDCDKDFCLRKYKLDTLYANSLLAPSQRKIFSLNIDADGTDGNEFYHLSNIAKDIKEFVRSGGNLFIHSQTCGNGKTSWAVRMINMYFSKIWYECDLSCHALFVSVPSFLQAIKANISEPNEYAQFILNNIKNADLVVWDDIANKVGTEYELNHLLDFIDTRIRTGKSNIFTSNLNAKELGQALGERLASRICNLSIDIELHGSDKRYLAKTLDGGNE